VAKARTRIVCVLLGQISKVTILVERAEGPNMDYLCFIKVNIKSDDYSGEGRRPERGLLVFY